MEPQSGVENQSKRLSTKTKTNRKKTKLKEIIEKALLEDDSSFTRQISSENFADDIASVDSVKDQMTSESQTADSAYHSCHSNDNTNLTESASRYSVDGMNSSEISSCSSFAANSRSGKNPKKVRADRKKSFAKIISQTLGDSLNLDVDIPEEDETARQQPGISDQKATRKLIEAKADVFDTWKSSMSKARSVTKKEIVSAEGGYAVCSKETGKRNAVFSSKSDTSKKAVREGRIESFLNSLKVQDVSEIETAYPLDSKTLLLGKKEVVKKPVTDVGAPQGMLESFFNNLKAQHASKIETTYPLDSKSLVLGKKEVVKKSVTGAYASYDFPDAIPSSCGIKTPLQIRPFGCFEHLSQKHVSLTSKNVSSASKDVSSTSKDVLSASKNVLSASKDVLSASKDVSSASNNVLLTSKDVLSASKTVLSASKDVLLASKDVSSTTKNISSASKNVSLTSKASKTVLSASKDVSSASKDVSSATKYVSSASKDVSSATKDVSLASKDVLSASKDVLSASKDVSSATKDVSLVTKDVSSASKDVSLASKGVSSASKNDSLECSVDRSFTDASVQVDLCDCPRLIGFHCSTNVSTSSHQNLSRSERNCENLNSGDKFFASGNSLSNTGDSKSIVPTSPCIIYSRAEANEMVASHPKDVTCNGVKANNKTICSREEASSDNLSQMFSRIGLADSLKNLPETDECNPDSNDSANITDNDEKTESKALDGNKSTEDNVSPERLDISLQVSFASDGVTDESFSRENLVDEIAASDVVVDLCDDSVASGPAFGSDKTILYDLTDSETTDESLFGDKVRKCEPANNVDRVSVDYIKTEADEWEGSESATRVKKSLGHDIKTKAGEADSADEDSSIHNLETDFRSISLQISLSSDDASDESDAEDRLESDQLEKLDKLLEEDKNASVLNDDDDDKSTSVLSDRSDKNVSILNDHDDKNASVVSDRDDLIVPESPQLSSDALSPSSAAEDGEEIEQVRNERQVIVSINTPSDHSFNCSVRNISLQVSLSSGGFSDTAADDLRMTEDYDRKDLDQKKPLDLKEIASPKESSLHQNPPSPQLPRNSNFKNCLFDMSDEEQPLAILPDDCDLADRSEVPRSVLCSTFLGRPSLDSVRRADVNWITSPVETENLSPDLRKLKSIRRVSLLASNKESTSDSYMSADGASLMVPDTSESDTERGMLYKTAYVECDGEEEFVADSSESPVHKSRRKKVHATEVINVSNWMSSDDDFENFLGRVKTTEKVKKSPPPALDDFIVDDSEGEEEGDHEEDDEREACDDDVISDDNDENDARVFYYQVDNKREEQNVDALSNRLEKALNFSLTSDSSDDDFQKVLPKRKDIPKKSGKIMFPSEDDDAKATPEAAADKEDAGIFRTPAPVISKKRILSVITPKVSSNSTLFDKRQAPYTVGHAAPPRYSFLKSLSSDVKEFLRDAKAARFVKSFKSLKKELTAELFTLYNREVFDSKIPSDMNIIWNDRLRRTAGFCRSRLTRDDPPKRLAQVELSVKVCDSPDRLRDTLIHEMCHAIVWLEHGSREVHGPIWKFWARKANRALADLPPITRCHSYDINTKYIYKCTKCGYEIGRHSKSLDTEKKICGHCRGQFELLVRPRNGSRTESAPSTPRTPNKFALYVKENYGDIKRTRPGVTHKEIMGVIGAQYSAKKAMLGDDRRVELIE